MNNRTKRDKETELLSIQCPESRLVELIGAAKSHFNQLFSELKLCLVEFLISSEREMLAGPKYQPNPGWKKWGAQEGSVYVGGERIQIKKPRLRKDQEEVQLSIYQKLREKGAFSEKVLEQALRGISCRDYAPALDGLLDSFGVSKSSVSRHIKTATTEKLKQLKERRFEGVEPFAIYIDGYHIAGKVFIVGLLIDVEGRKHVLGFWEGATENHEVCQALLSDMESRGLQLDKKILFITDGGKGIIKALKDRFGKLLVHQRCTVHKDRNIQRHLPKRYRQEAHRRFRNALDCVRYDDADSELGKLERWLDEINPSAAESVREAKEELLTMHRLGVPPLLRKTLHSTNPIESMFSQVSQQIRRITHMREQTKMAQRWLGTTLLHAEENFRTVKGYLSIPEVRERIKEIQSEIKASVA